VDDAIAVSCGWRRSAGWEMAIRQRPPHVCKPYAYCLLASLFSPPDYGILYAPGRRLACRKGILWTVNSCLGDAKVSVHDHGFYETGRSRMGLTTRARRAH
jgi:hypothetical protein